VAEANGVRAYLINGPDEIDRQWFDGVQGIGITPEEMVLAVIDALAPDSVSPIDGVAEDISFDLPRELRD
jgi:4-hydroxy-3-methylbut-2-enyl diphosphate reductase